MEYVERNLPVVTCYLNNGESMMSQAGAMCWMSPNIKMETIGGGFAKPSVECFQVRVYFKSLFVKRSGMVLHPRARLDPSHSNSTGAGHHCPKSSFRHGTYAELSVHLQNA